jgi:hypothetical protein
MPKNISFRNLIRKLKGFGFDGPYPGGKHPFMIKGELKLIIPNPHKEDISKSLISKILRQSGISKESWNELK